MKKLFKSAFLTRIASARTGRGALLLVLPAACLSMGGGCGKPREGQTPPEPNLPVAQVTIQAVTTNRVVAIEEVVGTVRARLRATIEAKATGRITEMPVRLGQKVKAGDLLARLDAPEVKARLEQAEAGLQQAERDWNRSSSLFKEQAATRADYDAAQARYLVATGAVAEARALMGYVEIVAPFDAVVTRKWVDVGDQAAPGKPLVDIEDPSRLQLEAAVPEASAGKIHQGMPMSIRAGEGTGELSGTVAEMAPSADPQTRTLQVKLELAGAPGLMSGQFARLLVPVGEALSLQVPASAVVQRGQMEIVFAVENQRARLHLVKTGRQLKDVTEILSGLDSGDLVVVDNAAQLLDGQPVSTR